MIILNYATQQLHTTQHENYIPHNMTITYHTTRQINNIQHCNYHTYDNYIP